MGADTLRHLVEALRMPWHDQPPDASAIVAAVAARNHFIFHSALWPLDAGKRRNQLQKSRFFALAAAGQQDHRPSERFAPAPTRVDLVRIRRGIELEVAEHAGHVRPQGPQPRGVGVGLRPHRGQRAVGWARERGQTLRLPERALVQPRIGQRHRHTPARAARDQVGPHLGFHQDAHAGLEVRQEARHGLRGVPRLPDLQVAGLQQSGTFGAPGGGAMGQQQPQARPGRAQRLQQDAGRARLAQRHGVDPEPARLRWNAVMAEPFLDRHRVAGLRSGPARELAAQKRLRKPGQQGIKGADHGHRSAAGGPSAPTRAPVNGRPPRWWRRASRCAAGPACRPRCGASPRACGPRSAAPAPAWCSSRARGRSRPASPPAGRRWC